jgi:hypothetical protein
LLNLAVAGTLASPISDVAPGELGSISRVDLFVNGQHEPSRSIIGDPDHPDAGPLRFTKALDPDSIQAPYKFSGAFMDTLAGVELQPGSNIIRLEARDPVTGYVGFSEWHTEIGLTPPAGLAHPFPATFDGYTIAAAAASKLAESQQGDANVYAIEVVAPAPVFDPELALAVALADGLRSVVARPDGKHYVAAGPAALDAGEVAGGGAAAGAAQTRVAVMYQSMQRLVERGGFVRLEDTDDFLLGVVKGIVDGPVAYVEAGRAVLQAVPFAVTYVNPLTSPAGAWVVEGMKLGMKVGPHAVDLFQKGKAVAANVGPIASEALKVAEEIYQGGLPLITAVMMGDEERLNQLSTTPVSRWRWRRTSLWTSSPRRWTSTPRRWATSPAKLFTRSAKAS